eukprot:Sdes_comp16238_c0_seq1m5538
MNFLGFGQSCDIDILLSGATPTRPLVEVKGEDGKISRQMLFYDKEGVKGNIFIRLRKAGMKFEHNGIKVECIGQIELFNDRGNHHEFISLSRALAPAGETTKDLSYAFDFPHVEKLYETYSGINVKLRFVFMCVCPFSVLF